MTQLAVESKCWDQDERQEKDRQLCETVGMLQERAEKRYGEPSVSRLRTDFLNGQYTFTKDRLGRSAMETLLRLESEFLSAYILQVMKIARSFVGTNAKYNSSIDFDDYVQEGCIALSKAVYHYNGTSAFTTYLQEIVVRSLLSTRERESLSGVSRDISKWRRMVLRAMSYDNLNLHEAIETVGKAEKLSERNMEKLADAIYTTKANDFHNIPSQNTCELDRELVCLCIEEANLTSLEKELIDAYMDGDSDFRGNLANTRINPNTGNLYTRQTLHNHFKSACNKVKDALMQREYAA